MAFTKKTLHIGNICRIEVTQVNTLQDIAIIEHIDHVRYVFSIQVFESLYTNQILTTKEPPVHRSGSVVGNRCIEDNAIERFMVSNLLIQNGTIANSLTTNPLHAVVIVERQQAIFLHDISLHQSSRKIGCRQFCYRIKVNRHAGFTIRNGKRQISSIALSINTIVNLPAVSHCYFIFIGSTSSQVVNAQTVDAVVTLNHFFRSDIP